MGTFTHQIRLFVDGRSETLDALVDTGATFTTVPSPVLDRLGVEPHRTVRLRLADGRVQDRRIGRVMAEIDSMQEEILCAFGAPDDLATIGAHTLEAFLLVADPIEQRLVPTEALWA